MQEKHHRGGLVGPILLLGIGLLLLGQNLGWVGGDIWLSLLRLWPLILIAIGIDLLIPRRTIWGTLLALLLIVAVFAAGIGLSGVTFGERQTLAAETIRIPIGNASEADVSLSPAVAGFHLRALTGPGILLEGNVPQRGYGTVTQSTRQDGSTAVVDIGTSGAVVIPAGVGPQDETWEFGLTSEVPIDLRFSMGAGEAVLDLTGLKLSGLQVDMGAGQMTVTLPATGRFSGHLSTAVGETILVIPQGMAVRLTFSTVLADVRTPDGKTVFGLSQHEYTSPGYATAENRIDLKIDQVIGQVTIRGS